MKTITKEETKVVKTEVYVSADGKEFNNKEDCLKWENSYVGTLNASWKELPKKEVNTCDFGIPWSSDDHNAYVVTPKNLDEITFINAYINCTTGYDYNPLNTTMVNKALLLNFGYDHDYCDVYVLEELLAKLQKNINECINPENPETKS